MLTTVASVTLRILLFRAGPQDLPFAPALSRVLIPFAVLVNYWVASLTLPNGMAVVSSVMAVLGLSAATRALLRIRQLENRYTQSFHALMLTSAVMALAFIVPMQQLLPDILKMAQDPKLMEANPAALNLPAGPVLMFDALLIWNFAVTVNIYRQAANLKLSAAILISMLISMSLLMFVGFATSLVSALFGLTPTPTPMPAAG